MKKVIYVFLILMLSVNIVHALYYGDIAKYEVPPYRYVKAKYKGPLTDQQIISALEESIDYFHKWNKHTQSKFIKKEPESCNDKYIRECYYYGYDGPNGFEYTIGREVLNYKTFQEAYSTRINQIMYYIFGYEISEKTKLPDTSTIIKANQFNDIIIVKKGNTYVFAITVDSEVEESYYLNKRSDGYIELIKNGSSE